MTGSASLTDAHSVGKAKQFARNSFWLAVSTTSVVLIGAVYRPMIGRILGPTEYGQYSFIQTYVTYFLVIAFFGVRSVVTREIGRDPTTARAFIDAAYRLRAITTLIAVAVCCAVGYALQREQQVTVGIYVLSLSIIFLAIGDLLEGVLVALQRSFYVAVANVVGNLVKLGLGVWALHAGYGLIGVLVAFLPASAITAGLNWWFVRAQFASDRSPAPRGPVRYVFRESVPFLVLFMAGKLYAKNDVLFLSLLRGDMITGLYSAAYVFVDLLISISNCFAQAAYPMIARLHGSPDNGREEMGLAESYERLHKHMLLIFLPVSVLLTSLGGECLGLIFGQRYVSGLFAMRVLVWVPPLEVSSLVSGIFLSGTYRQGLEARIATAMMTLNVVWTVSFIVFFGAMGAAIATVGASLVNAVVRYIYVKRNIGPARLVDTWLRPLACAGLMLLGAEALSHSLWFWRLFAGLAVYALALTIVGAYDKVDRRMLLSIVRR